MSVPVGPSTVVSWLFAAGVLILVAAGRVDPEPGLAVVAAVLGINNGVRGWQATRN